MAIGQEHTLLPGIVANPAFDYVALGHIHRHQVLSEKPPVVYAGSLERLDFGEEADDKGFYLVEIGDGEGAGKRAVRHVGRGKMTQAIEQGEDRSSPCLCVERAAGGIYSFLSIYLLGG